MATTQDLWNKVAQDERFQDLDPDKKEAVRQKFWKTRVQQDPRYQALPQSKREMVRQRFDDFSAIPEEGTIAGIERKAKPYVKEAKAIAGKIPGAVEKGALATEAGLEKVEGAIARNKTAQKVSKGFGEAEEMSEKIEPTPMKAGYAAMKGIKSGIEKGGEYLASKMEPNYIKPALSNFDVARAIGSGAVRTMSQALSGVLSTSYPQTMIYGMMDAAHTGATYLSRDHEMPLKGVKASMSGNATQDMLENMITQTRIENYARGNAPKPAGLLKGGSIPLGGEGSTGMLEGKARPLEVLANEEQKVAAQQEVSEYQDWLKQADLKQANPRAGLPDIYPEAKTNVSQLLEAAQERLRKLQTEPVRVESLSNAEDALQGYYRHRIDQQKVFLQTGAEAPKAIGPGPEGPKMIEAPQEQPKPGQPADLTPPAAAPSVAPRATPKRAPVKIPSTHADYATSVYQKFFPDKPIEALKANGSALAKALGFAPKGAIEDSQKVMYDKLIESEHLKHIESEKPPTPKQVASDTARMAEKGIDRNEVEYEAKRLRAEHQTEREARVSRNDRFNELVGKIRPNYPDQMGNVPEMEEYKRHVIQARRTTDPNAMTMDQAAQVLFDNHEIPSPDISALHKYLDGLDQVGHPRSWQSFMDEAHRNVEHDMKVQAGLAPEEELSLSGEKAGEAGPVQGAGEQTTIPGTDATFEGAKPKPRPQDIKNRDAHDLLWDLWKGLDEKGEVGLGGDIDPIKQAEQEAIVKELVQRAMAMGYQSSQDIMLYAARNAPAEIQAALRKNLAPTLSAFDDHAYKEMDEAKKGNPVARKSMMDSATRSYLKDKMAFVKEKYRKFNANAQIAAFKDADEGLMKLKNDFFLHDNYRKFSKDELAAQRWYTEGKAPKLESLVKLGYKEEDARRWLNLAKNPTDQMKAARKMTQAFEDERHDLISAFYDSVGYREDYVMRRWERPDEYLDWEGRTLGNNPNFLKGRKLLTQAEGIDAGLKPKELDIREDLRAGSRQQVNVLSRIHAYQKLGASFGPDGMPALIDESEAGTPTQARNAKITPHSGKAPGGWVRMPNVPLLNGLALNPYYKSSVEYLLARPFQGTTPEVLNFIAASTKATKLLGFFHGLNLNEMGLTGINYRDVFSFAKDRNPFIKALRYTAKAMTADMEGKMTPGKLYDSFMSGHGVLANRPLALDMAEHNFKFGTADGDMYGILTKFLAKTQDELAAKIGAAPSKALMVLPRTAVDLTNKTIFQYMRPIWSMIVYESNLADNIKKFNLDAPEGMKIPIDKIKSDVVNATSKEMGGIAWSRMMIQPKTQQILQWAFLAPEWKMAQYLRASSLFSGGAEGRQTRKQFMKLMVGWYVISQMANYARTKSVLGKGRWLQNNPEGFKSQVFLYKNGQEERYAQVSKNLTDMFDDFQHPGQVASRAMSPMVRAAASVMNWAGDTSYHAGAAPENPIKAVEHAYEPMFESGNSAYGILPTRRGPSKNRIEGMINRYYEGGMKDQRLYNDAMQTAIENGFDPVKLDRSVRGNRTRQHNREASQLR